MVRPGLHRKDRWGFGPGRAIKMDELRAAFVQTWLEILACTPPEFHSLMDERVAALLYIARQLEKEHA